VIADHKKIGAIQHRLPQNVDNEKWLFSAGTTRGDCDGHQRVVVRNQKGSPMPNVSIKNSARSAAPVHDLPVPKQDAANEAAVRDVFEEDLPKGPLAPLSWGSLNPLPHLADGRRGEGLGGAARINASQVPGAGLDRNGFDGEAMQERPKYFGWGSLNPLPHIADAAKAVGKVVVDVANTINDAIETVNPLPFPAAWLGIGVGAPAVSLALIEHARRLKVDKPAPNWQFIDARNLGSLPARGYQLLPIDRLYRAKGILRQQDMGGYARWCCGPNSALRCLALLGRPVPNAMDFVEKCPRHEDVAFVPVPAFGPTHKELANYLTSSGHFNGLRLGTPTTDNWNDILHHLQKSVDLQQPMILLLVFSEFKMHYVTLAGYNRNEGKVLIVDTDGSFYALTLDELKLEMNANNTIPQKFGTFGLYNGVVFHG